MEWQTIYTDWARLVIAALVGALIGFEREAHGQAAGLRTYILVCMGSCLMMLLSLHMEAMFQDLAVDQSVVRLDPGRIASYAIASMGFLGAGAIITGKGTVRGLTTAAGLWLVTGIGLAIGAGYLLPALSATAISAVILYGLRRLKTFLPRLEHTIITLKFAPATKLLPDIKNILSEEGIHVNFTSYQVDIPNDAVIYRLRLESYANLPWGRILQSFLQLEGVTEMKWEEGEVP